MNEKRNNYKIKLNDNEINDLVYKHAIKIDKRTYTQYYWSLLKTGHLFFFSFFPNNDYNIMAIKISLFFFSFGLHYTVNALFFTDSMMNTLYEIKGEGEYVLKYQIANIISSSAISIGINVIIKFLSLSGKDILKIRFLKKREKLGLKVAKIKKCIKIKFILFYILSFLFLFVFWFYVTCFCAVYPHTQLYLIKNTTISFCFSLIYPFGYYLIPGIFRIP